MCDTVCALGSHTISGASLYAKNSDRPPGEPQDVDWYPPRVDDGLIGTTWIRVAPHREATLGVLGSRPRWQWGFEHGVNEAGLAVGNEAVYTNTNPRRSPDALIGMDIVRLCLERCTTVFEAVDLVGDLLDRYGQGGPGHDQRAESYWSSFVLVDADSAAVVDTDHDEFAVEWVMGARAVSNQLSVDGFAADRALRSSIVDAVVTPRAAASRAFVAASPIGVDDVRRHLRSHVGGDAGWTICMHADTSATTASMIASLPIEGRPQLEVLLGQPCTSVFLPVAVGPVDLPRWEAFAAVARPPDEREEFEAALRADARPDPSWNAEMSARVRAYLRGPVA